MPFVTRLSNVRGDTDIHPGHPECPKNAKQGIISDYNRLTLVYKDIRRNLTDYDKRIWCHLVSKILDDKKGHVTQTFIEEPQWLPFLILRTTETYPKLVKSHEEYVSRVLALWEGNIDKCDLPLN